VIDALAVNDDHRILDLAAPAVDQPAEADSRRILGGRHRHAGSRKRGEQDHHQE